MTKFKTVLTSIVTKLGLVAAVLGILVAELTPYVAVPVVGVALPYVTSAVVVVGVLSRIVRKVTEVPDDLVGLEPASTLDKAVSFGNAAATDEAFWGDVA